VSFPTIPQDGAYLGSFGDCNGFHFAVLGDTHTHRTTHPGEQSETTHRIIEELNHLQPAFVLSAGDVIRGYTTDEERLRVEHTGAKEALGSLQMPYFPCIGNHDVREEISEAVWRDFWGGRYYSFDFADCHFLMLDAEQSKDVESVAGEQLEWLEKDLAEHADGRRVFVTLHRPWWYDRMLHTAEWKRPGGRNDWNDIVDPILRKYDLQAVFCGHLHNFEYEVRNSVPHIVSGGAGGDVKRMPDAGGVAHYIWVHVGSDSFEWSVVVPGQIFTPPQISNAEGDFGKLIPWIGHPQAARSGIQHIRETQKPTFGQRMRRVLQSFINGSDGA